MNELKPCPFGCNGEVEVYSYFSTVYERIYGEVRCTVCGCKKRGDVTFDTYTATMKGYATQEWAIECHRKAKESAIEAWNTRAGEHK